MELWRASARHSLVRKGRIINNQKFIEKYNQYNADRFIEIYSGFNRLKDHCDDAKYERNIRAIGSLIRNDIIDFDVEYPDRGPKPRRREDYLLPYDIQELFYLDEDLQVIAEQGRYFRNDQTVINELAIVQECHVVSTLWWVLYPETFDLCTGIAERYCGHSWLRHKATGIIHEPTPILRETYFGVVMTDPYRNVKSDDRRIRRLIESGKISQDLGNRYKAAMEELCV